MLESISSVPRMVVFAVAMLVALTVSGYPAVAAAGYWRYARTEILPAQSALDDTRRASGGKVEPRVSGGFEPAGKGMLALHFKTENAERKTFLTEVTFVFGASPNMTTLTPGETLTFETGLAIESNFPGAYATAKMALNNGDYFIDTAAAVSDDGSGSGSVIVPKGSPNDTLRIYAAVYLSNDGALSETITNFYDWVEGPVPNTGETAPDPELGADAQGDFSGAWSSSEGALALSQSGAGVSGTYSQDNGRISGEVADGHLTGYWGEDSSGQECETERLGTYFWGRIDWTLAADGRHFEGAWSYCDAPPTGSWSGQRAGE